MILQTSQQWRNKINPGGTNARFKPRREENSSNGGIREKLHWKNMQIGAWPRIAQFDASSGETRKLVHWTTALGTNSGQHSWCQCSTKLQKVGDRLKIFNSIQFWNILTGIWFGLKLSNWIWIWTLHLCCRVQLYATFILRYNKINFVSGLMKKPARPSIIGLIACSHRGPRASPLPKLIRNYLLRLYCFLYVWAKLYTNWLHQ